MKTKLFLILISIIIGINVYSQDTISYYSSPLDYSNPNCPSGINFLYIGDTLDIYGTITLIGCGKQIAIINIKNDSILINTKDIISGADCNIAYNACFAIKLKTSDSDTILKFNNVIYNISPDKINSDSIPINYNVAVNDTVHLDLVSNPSTGYSWMWTNKSSASIVDTFNHSYIPDTPITIGSGGIEIWNFKIIKAGIDTVKLEYISPRKSGSTIQTKIIIIQANNILSISSAISGLSDRINLYPNPATDKITIINNENSAEKPIVSIFNTAGQQIMSEQFNGQNLFQMDVSSLAKGIYFVKIQTNTGIESKKLVIQ